jgi:branched-chain amino acid transport system substrate-binding protein
MLVTRLGIALAMSLIGSITIASAQKNYSPGASDTEVKIGQTQPYSGPASANSSNGQADSAFFKMVNDQGGVNGRKITLDSVDDSYAPPRTVEQTRRLVEQDEVMFFYRSMGTAPAIGTTLRRVPTAWAPPSPIRPRRRSSRAMRCR